MSPSVGVTHLSPPWGGDKGARAIHPRRQSTRAPPDPSANTPARFPPGNRRPAKKYICPATRNGVVRGGINTNTLPGVPIEYRPGTRKNMKLGMFSLRKSEKCTRVSRGVERQERCRSCLQDWECFGGESFREL